MKIFKDESLTEEITVLDLGIVPAGETETFTFWIMNDSGALLKHLEFFVEHEEVRITKAPEELPTNAVDELIIEWNPSITLKQGLKARLRIKGIELWG